MFRSLTRIALAITITLLGTTAVTANNSAPAFMHTSGKTSQPIGHYEFCQRHPAECAVRNAHSGRIKLTPDAWNELVAVNNAVNTGYQQTTDIQLFGRPEVWTYPQHAGDCEDLALQKRRILHERGWPIGALLITVVRQSNGEGHAVLTVLTDRGDLVLDNLDTRVLVWSQTSLQFVKRQSQFHTGEWTAINDSRPISVVGSLTP